MIVENEAQPHSDMTKLDVERMNREQESLRKVIESISSERELRPLLTRILIHACELLKAQNGTIGLYDPEQEVIRTEATFNMPEDELGSEAVIGVGLFGLVAKRGAPVILNRYGDLELPLRGDLLENSVIGVPIFWHSQQIGVFGLGSLPPHRFTEEDAEVLNRFSKHAAIAIENARLFSRMQGSLTDMRLLYETGQRINSSSNIPAIVKAYLEQVAAKHQYSCSIALYERDQSGRKQQVCVHGRWNPGTGYRLDEIRIPYSEDRLDALLDAGETVAISDVHRDERATEALRELQKDSGRPALAFIPLIARRVRIGLVILSLEKVHEWSLSDLHPYQITAATLATGIDGRVQQDELMSNVQRITILEERRRLAGDLHDSVSQLLFSITLIAQSLGQAFLNHPEEGERRVERLLQVSQSAHTEMRALLRELRPSELTHERANSNVPADLLSSLRNYIRNIDPGDMRIELLCPAELVLAPELTDVALRIAQEGLNNIVKHSGAKSAEIRIRRNENSLLVLIKDDGVGFVFDEERSADCTGIGLRQMRERAIGLNGAFRIESEIGKGTLIEVELPEERAKTA